ncbi:MAG TPA: SDR family NAD(P)-dependent oxidoreductase [Vicinamibacterales bacterium]|nr:SDR family NAD(P)-dependent oxidoreductase [Vicinamibacterales bacterium]
MQDVTGRRALVTGASRGIGRAIALALAAAGVDVAVNYRSSATAADAVAQAIERSGRRAVAIAADVSSAGEVERLVAETERALGGIDILVNNAGIGTPLPLDAIGEREWDEVMDVNLKSCFLATQRALPGMRARRWGRIINLSSVAAQVGGVIGPHYAASKAGVLGLTRYYARHLAREGITANAIAPALIETDMVTSNPNAKVDLIPVGRFGDVDEVADAAVMLARNGYITGQTVNVNGGWFFS